MLFRWRNVAGRPVGQFQVEGGFQRALSFQLQACDPVDLVRNRRDSEFADSNGLQNDLRFRVVVHPFCLLGVNFDAIAGRTIRAGGIDRASPFASSLRRNSSCNRESLLGHGERVTGSVLDRLPSHPNSIGYRLRVLLSADPAAGLAVVHPVQIAAGPLRHDSDKAGGFLPRLFADPSLQHLGCLTEVVRRKRSAPEIVHRQVRHHANRRVVFFGHHTQNR